MILWIWSKLVSSGLSPPCMQMIFSSMSPTTGRQLKQSVNAFQSLMLYLLLPSINFRTRESLLLTFIIKPVDSVNRGALVIPPQQEKILWVLDLVGQQETDRFEALLPPVDVVAQEEVIGFWGEAPVLEKPQQVVILPVDVASNNNHFNGKSYSYHKSLSEPRALTAWAGL